MFRRQIPAALNFSMSGIPYWSADIGGFFGGDPKEAGYAELFTRWLQFAVFNPMFRIHGTGAGKEIYSFAEPSQPALIDAVRLRYRLLPWLYSLSWRMADGDGSFFYPVDTVYRDDRAARDLTDQFLFGRDVMVSPVVEPGATSRAVTLPAGTDWYDFWTGARMAGGQRVTVAAPIGQVPLHVAAGSILPMGPVVQHSGADPDAPLELRVYRGRDGRFTLYDDAGDGPGWQHGEHATIAIRLDDTASTLTLGPRQGRYPGMQRVRRLRIVTVAPDRGAGLAEAGRAISYDGRAMTVRLDPAAPR